MKIGIPIGQFHPGNTGEYVQRALVELGHEATILNHEEFVTAFLNNEYEHFFCVDSSKTINLTDYRLNDKSFENISFWFIDFRHNKFRQERNPPDFEIAKTLNDRGGIIFQSQYEDYEFCIQHNIKRVWWLPLAADPVIWSDAPVQEKKHHLVFNGGVYDMNRKKVLDRLLAIKGLLFGYKQLWKEEAADFLRSSLIGFNVNTSFGESWSFDVNMRVYEVLSCGLPLITNWVPNLYRIIPDTVTTYSGKKFPLKAAPFIKTYRSIADIFPLLQDALTNKTFLESGSEARKFILDNHTYRHRMEKMLTILGMKNLIAH